MLVWGAPALLLAISLTDIHRHQRRHCDDEAILASAAPDPGVVLVVPAAHRASRLLENYRGAETSGNRDGDHPTAYAVDVTDFQR